jgi:hypothetical protein
MPSDANPKAAATAALAAILFSFIVNSSIGWLPCRDQGNRPAAHRRKRQGAHDYLLICLSSHSTGALTIRRKSERLPQ